MTNDLQAGRVGTQLADERPTPQPLLFWMQLPGMLWQQAIASPGPQPSQVRSRLPSANCSRRLQAMPLPLRIPACKKILSRFQAQDMHSLQEMS